jgi:hypothetical protein
MSDIYIQGELGGNFGPSMRTPNQARATNPIFTENAMGIDSLAWKVPLQSPISTPDLIPSTGEKITLWQDGVVKFRGWARRPELDDSGTQCTVQINVLGPAWFLQQESISSDVTDPLGLAAQRTSFVFPSGQVGDMITALLNRAIALGLPVAVGTISSTFVSPRVTLSQMSFLDALAELCRMVPDGVGFWDYSHDPAQFNFIRRADLQSVVFDRGALHSDLTYLSARLSPRDDLAISNVLVPFVERLPDGRSVFNAVDSTATQASATVFSGANGSLKLTSRLAGSAGNQLSASFASGTITIHTLSGDIPVPYVTTIQSAVDLINTHAAQPSHVDINNVAGNPCIHLTAVPAGAAGNAIILELGVVVAHYTSGVFVGYVDNAYNPVSIGATASTTSGITTVKLWVLDGRARTIIQTLNNSAVAKQYVTASLVTDGTATEFDWCVVPDSGSYVNIYTTATSGIQQYVRITLTATDYALSGANDGASAWIYAETVGLGSDSVTTFSAVNLAGGVDPSGGSIGHRQIRSVSGPEMAAFLPPNNLDSVRIQTSDLSSVTWDLVSSLDSSWSAFRFRNPAITPLLTQLATGNTWESSALVGNSTYQTAYLLGQVPSVSDEFGNIVDISQWDRLLIGSVPEWLTKDLGLVALGGTIKGTLAAYATVATVSSGIQTWYGLPSWWSDFVSGASFNKALYTGTNSSNYSYMAYAVCSFAVPVTLINTHQRTMKTYFRSTDYDYVRPPATFAADLLAAQAFLPYVGEIRANSADLVLGGWLGKKFSISNSLLEYATMGALPKSAVQDLYQGILTLRMGPPDRMGLDGIQGRLRRTPQDNITVLR